MEKWIKYIVIEVCFFITCYAAILQLFDVLLSSIFSFVISMILSYFFFRKIKNQLALHQLVLLCVFFSLLLIPLVGEKETESSEKRTLVEFPQWRWSNVWVFFKDYQKYFNDHFAYRNQLLNTYGKIKYEKLGFRVITNQVMSGEGKWLFYNEKTYVKRMSTPFTKKELQQFHYNLVLTTKWFEKYGIKYYLTIPPIKPRIYYEELPDYLKLKFSFSKIEQINNYLKEQHSINFIDYRKELLLEKRIHEVYYKTDTHWNEYGSFVAYTKIIATIAKDFPEITPNSLSEYRYESFQFDSGDLLSMLGYKTELNEKQDHLIKKGVQPLKREILIAQGKKELWNNNLANKNLKIFIVRDSFSEQLKMFLSINFKQSVYFWSPQLPINDIAEHKPEIVLHEVVEKFCHFYLKLSPEIQADTSFTQQFNINDF